MDVFLMRTCPNCAERVSADSLKCPKYPCSANFEMCSYCRAEIPGAPLECPVCYKDL